MMGNSVYANGMEVSCKASGGVSICALPDTCFTPPLTPATPPGVPIPYPNTASASDTSNGSSTVKSSGEEVMLKNKSKFKSSTGDEAGSAPKKNAVTSNIKGPAYFAAWSMDVKIEGENVVRHMDLTTHNHGCDPPGTPPQLHTALQAMGNISDCKDDVAAVKTHCDPWEKKATCPEETEASISKAQKARGRTKKGSAAYDKANAQVRELYQQYSVEIEANDCRRFLRCVLIPYKDVKKVACKKQTGDHLIEKATVEGMGDYKMSTAPTAIVEGPSYHIGTHGLNHEARTQMAKKSRGKYTMEKSAEQAGEAHCQTFPVAQCDPGCITKQLVEAHEDAGIDKSDEVEKPTLNSEHNRDYQGEWDAHNIELADEVGLSLGQ
jgi:hypothetical protein